MGKGQCPKCYKNILGHFFFDMKHDVRHKSRLVSDGHLTDVPLYSVCSGVMSRRGIRLFILLVELNGLES